MSIAFRRPQVFIAGLLAGAAIGLSAFSGCDSQETIVVQSGEKDAGGRGECQQQLETILNMVQPDRLGLSADPKDAADLLNEWMPGCGGDEPFSPEIDPAAAQLIQPVVSSEQLSELGDERFAARDADHLRNAILFKQTADFAAASADDDLDRVTQLFHHVVQSIALTGSGDGASPLTLSPYEILLFGRGSAEDRAWIFAEVLRQLRIDAVIVRPGNGEGDEDQADESQHGDGWLVGVLLDGDVYLFDARLGWPIPSPEDDGKTPLVRRPATLAEAAADPELLRKLDVDDEHKHPLSADDLKAVRVEAIGHDQYWMPRMARLEASLAGERSVTIYDGLGKARSGAGAIERVAAAGSSFWERDDVTVWPYPQQSMQGYARLQENNDQRLLIRMFPFQAPVPISINEQEQKVDLGRPQRQQLETRIAQLQGRYEDAVKSYQLIRIAANINPQLPVPAELRLMHARAADDAVYWVGLSQYQMEDYDAAAETLSMYLRSNPNGQWVEASTNLRALCLAQDGNYDAAVKVMTALSVRNPQRGEYDLLARRWRGLRD